MFLRFGPNNLEIHIRNQIFWYFYAWSWSCILWVMSVGWKIIDWLTVVFWLTLFDWSQVLCWGLWVCERGERDEEGDLEARTHRLRGRRHCKVWRVSRTFSVHLVWLQGVTLKGMTFWVLSKVTWKLFYFIPSCNWESLICLLAKVHRRHLRAEEKAPWHQPRDLSGRVGERQGCIKSG